MADDVKVKYVGEAAPGTVVQLRNGSWVPVSDGSELVTSAEHAEELIHTGEWEPAKASAAAKEKEV